MRPIKLRFWCDTHHYVKSGFNQTIEAIFFDQRDELGLPCSLCYKSRPMKLEQWTGLLDKNGVEIYEGDVVDTLHKKYPKQYPEKFYPNGTPAREVKWIVGPHHNGWNIYAGKKSQCEVIGNIHENPELLESAS